MPPFVKLEFEGQDDPQLKAFESSLRGDLQSEVRPSKKLNHKWTNGLKAFCLLLVRASISEEGIDGEHARLLAGALKEEGRSRVIWPAKTSTGLLGDRHHVRELLIIDAGKGLISLNRNMIQSADIKIWWNGGQLTLPGPARRTDLLDKLARALNRTATTNGGSKTADPSELEKELNTRFADEAWKPRFLVASEANQAPAPTPLVSRAAMFVRAELQRFLHLKETPICAVSGGVAQWMVAREMERLDTEAKIAGGKRLKFTALNRLSWLDLNVQRSAEHVALWLAKIHNSEELMVVPPSNDCAEWADDFRARLEKVDLFMLSGGSARGSFVDQYLRQCRTPAPARVIGDLAGHLLDENGADGGDRSTRKLLQVFRCHPTLGELRRFAADPEKTVLLFLYEPPHPSFQHDPASTTAISKLRLVQACLAGRLVNRLVLSAPLARELLA